MMKRDQKPVSNACVETTSIATVPDFLEADVFVKQFRSFKVVRAVAKEGLEVPNRWNHVLIAHRFPGIILSGSSPE